MIHEADDREKEWQAQSVLAEYVRRCDAGETVDIESYCQSFPEFALNSAYVNGEGLLKLLGKPVDQATIESDVSRLTDTVRPGTSWRVRLSQCRVRTIPHHLAAGEMGSISLAEDTHLGRQVALKIPW